MKKTLLVLALATVGAALLATGGCTIYETGVVYAHPEPIYVSTAPPPPRVEVQGIAPAQDHIWIQGSWSWRSDTWVWVDGRWVPPRPGYGWVAPRVERYGDGYRYNPGYWRPASPTPPPRS